MSIEIKAQQTSAAAAVGCKIKLGDNVPTISLEDVQAVIRRSKTAARLKADFDDRVGCKGVFSRGEVKDLLERAGGTGKKADPNQAVVIAYYAQNHAEVFAPDAAPLVEKFLGDVDWAALMADLKKFMEDLQAKEAEIKKQEQIKKEMLQDDVKRDDRKRDLVKQNGTSSERKAELQKREAQKAEERQRLREASPHDLDDEVTANGQLDLSDVQRTKLALLKKGFANRD